MPFTKNVSENVNPRQLNNFSQRCPKKKEMPRASQRYFNWEQLILID